MYTDTEWSRSVNIHHSYDFVAQTKVYIVFIFIKERKKRRKEGKREESKKECTNKEIFSFSRFDNISVIRG